MIDENMKINKEEKKIYPPLPQNIYTVELLDITLEDAKGKFAKPGDKNFKFQFTLLDGSENGESLRGRNVWENFVPTSLYVGKSGKNKLYQIIEAFMGRLLTQEEEATGITGGFLNSLIGKQIRIFVDHKQDKNDSKKVYDNIKSYMKLETAKIPLTAEEKDNAKVKKEKEESMPQYEEEISVENIPFNQF